MTSITTTIIIIIITIIIIIIIIIGLIIIIIIKDGATHPKYPVLTASISLSDVTKHIELENHPFYS